MANYVFIQWGLLVVICQYFILLTNANLSSTEECEDQQTGTERIFKVKEHQHNFCILEQILREMNTTIDKLTKDTENMKSIITIQNGEIRNLTNTLEREKMAIQVHDCKDILDAGESTGDGLYKITVNDDGKDVEKEVYCDMTTDNGGWTVFQYRYNGSVDFYKVYNEYTEGFGRYPGEFWLGLKWINAITTRGQYMLRVDLTGKDPSGDGQVTGFAKYTNFSIGPAAGSYMLHIDGYLQNSTIVDRLMYEHNGQGFTTQNHDVDRWSGGFNCAVRDHGAWWYGRCGYSNLNGHYLEPGVDNDTSMNWLRWPTGYRQSLVASQLSFKPV